MPDTVICEQGQIQTQQEIAKEIEGFAEKLKSYKAWIIGTTDHPGLISDIYKMGNMRFWEAESIDKAQEIMNYFVRRGMLEHFCLRETQGRWVFVY